MRILDNLPFLAISIIPLALGCGGNVTFSGGGAGGGGGSTSSSTGPQTGGEGGATPSTTPTDTGPAPGFCAGACETTAEGGCLNTADCTAYCEAHLPEWPASVAGGFEVCVAENPLCFESIEGCILSQLYSADDNHTVKLTGTGLDAWNGKTLHAWNDPDAGAPFGSEVVLADGQFAFEWSAPFQAAANGGPLLLLYIDIDADGACVAAADLTHSAFTQWNGDYLNPVFSAAIAPPLHDGDFVCDFTP